MDLLSLMYDLFDKSRKRGVMSIEADVDDPLNSEILLATLLCCLRLSNGVHHRLPEESSAVGNITITNWKAHGSEMKPG